MKIFSCQKAIQTIRGLNQNIFFLTHLYWLCRVFMRPKQHQRKHMPPKCCFKINVVRVVKLETKLNPTTNIQNPIQVMFTHAKSTPLWPVPLQRLKRARGKMICTADAHRTSVGIKGSNISTWVQCTAVTVSGWLTQKPTETWVWCKSKFTKYLKQALAHGWKIHCIQHSLILQASLGSGMHWTNSPVAKVQLQALHKMKFKKRRKKKERKSVGGSRKKEKKEILNN